MKISFRYSVILLGVLCLVFFSSGCANNTKKFAEMSNGFAKNINQLSKDPGIIKTGFASNPDKKLFKIGIGLDRSKITDEHLKEVIITYLKDSASFVSEQDYINMLEPYNLQIEELSKDGTSPQLIVQKLAGSNEIEWENINLVQ